jgi:hypothetical protein
MMMTRLEAPKRRLLVISCSATKTAGPNQGHKLYNGPAFHVLRGNCPPDNSVAVRILSAKYGIVPTWRVLAPYDQRMDAATAQLHGMKRENIQALADAIGPDTEDMLVWGGPHYRAAVRLMLESIEALGQPLPLVQYSEGMIGQMLHQLKCWLRSEPTGLTPWMPSPKQASDQ